MKNFLFALVFLSLPAWAGNFVNNGIDQLDEKGDAVWFVGQREIQGCFEVADGFGVDPDASARTIRRAFAIWAEYFEKKGLNQETRVQGLEFSTGLNLHQGCRGGEDISFYLGVENNLLVKASLGFRRPLAFAQRTAYDETTRWGKGLIWIAPPSAFAEERLDWNRDNHLLGALLHEIGHVYGCGHIGSTIMRPEISENILSSANDFLNVMNQIDSGKQLYVCELCGGEFRGTIVHENVIATLIGRPLSGKITTELKLESDSSRLPHGTLEIRDARGAVEVEVRARSILAEAFSDILLFHVPVTLDKSKNESFASRHAGKVFLATLRLGERTLNVVYKRNMDIFTGSHAPYADQMVLLDPNISNTNLIIFVPKK